MNVTNDRFKDRQLHIEGYLQMVSTESKEYAEVSACQSQEQLIQQLKEGKYKPNPVRRVEIPKEIKGEFRKLGVPTVVDRVL